MAMTTIGGPRLQFYFENYTDEDSIPEIPRDPFEVAECIAEAISEVDVVFADEDGDVGSVKEKSKGATIDLEVGGKMYLIYVTEK